MIYMNTYFLEAADPNILRNESIPPKHAFVIVRVLTSNSIDCVSYVFDLGVREPSVENILNYISRINHYLIDKIIRDKSFYLNDERITLEMEQHITHKIFIYNDVKFKLIY